MTTDGDSFTTVDCSDDLSVAGNDAYAGPAEHSPYATCGCIMGDGLIGQLHIGCHTPRHRHAQDTALYEPRPLACFVDGVFERHFVLAVQSFCYRA